jgi:hypothetical protein
MDRRPGQLGTYKAQSLANSSGVSSQGRLTPQKESGIFSWRMREMVSFAFAVGETAATEVETGTHVIGFSLSSDLGR